MDWPADREDVWAWLQFGCIVFINMILFVFHKIIWLIFRPLATWRLGAFKENFSRIKQVLVKLLDFQFYLFGHMIRVFYLNTKLLTKKNMSSHLFELSTSKTNK